jgi:CDGSH-type Zn-finger protein
VHADISLDTSLRSIARPCALRRFEDKPFCDSSHHVIAFSATGEPPTGNAEINSGRDGPLSISPNLMARYRSAEIWKSRVAQAAL